MRCLGGNGDLRLKGAALLPGEGAKQRVQLLAQLSVVCCVCVYLSLSLSISLSIYIEREGDIGYV